MKTIQTQIWASREGRELLKLQQSQPPDIFISICNVSVDELKQLGEAIAEALKLVDKPPF